MIAQGLEAGGHRGMFLSDDLGTQVGLFALLPQVVDAVKVPVIATGGIGDARAIVGGAGARRCRRADRHGVSVLPGGEDHCRRIARRCEPRATTAPSLTNVFSGRPARGLDQPRDPRARADQRHRAGISARQRRVGAAACQGAGARARATFLPMLAGQAAALGRELPAGELVAKLVAETQDLLRRIKLAGASKSRLSP